MIVIGDRKSPDEWACDGVEYWGYRQQAQLQFAVATELPSDSYTRKMLGYLIAASHGAQWIRETDDDNAPYESFFDPVPDSLQARPVQSATSWVNVYAYFTDRFIWPRGFPLGLVRESLPVDPEAFASNLISGDFVLQAVADGDPDVDAVYRMTAPDRSDVSFRNDAPIVLQPGSWCPFNSQATTWPRALFPLMYLPTTCSFRMTDIWRSFIAQRLMPGLDAHLVFTGPTVSQDRNAHDLMRDFRDEIEGYAGYERLVEVLLDVPLVGGAHVVLDDLRRCYTGLIAAGFLRDDELRILDAWLADMRSLGFGS